jgi:hypothetical protein
MKLVWIMLVTSFRLIAAMWIVAATWVVFGDDVASEHAQEFGELLAMPINLYRREAQK